MPAEDQFVRGEVVCVRTPDREFYATVLRVNKNTLRVRSMDDGKEYLAGMGLCEAVGIGAGGNSTHKTKTPWGIAETRELISPGITFFTTSRHGGFFIDPELNTSIPEGLKNPNGWYEQDCEWCKVVLAFPEQFARDLYVMAVETLTSNYPTAAALHADRVRRQLSSGKHGTRWTPFVPPVSKP